MVYPSSSYLISQRLILKWEPSSLLPFQASECFPSKAPNCPSLSPTPTAFSSLHCLGQTSASKILEDCSPSMGTDIFPIDDHTLSSGSTWVVSIYWSLSQAPPPFS